MTLEGKSDKKLHAPTMELSVEISLLALDSGVIKTHTWQAVFKKQQMVMPFLHV